MSTSDTASGNDCGSPDQAAANVDSESLESEWVDEEDDDDMDFDPVADSSDQDADFLDQSEDAEAEFHGMVFVARLVNILYSTKALTNHEYHIVQMPRMD